MNVVFDCYFIYEDKSSPCFLVCKQKQPVDKFEQNVCKSMFEFGKSKMQLRYTANYNIQKLKAEKDQHYKNIVQRLIERDMITFNSIIVFMSKGKIEMPATLVTTLKRHTNYVYVFDNIKQNNWIFDMLTFFSRNNLTELSLDNLAAFFSTAYRSILYKNLNKYNWDFPKLLSLSDQLGLSNQSLKVVESFTEKNKTYTIQPLTPDFKKFIQKENPTDLKLAKMLQSEYPLFVLLDLENYILLSVFDSNNTIYSFGKRNGMNDKIKMFLTNLKGSM